MPRVVAAAGIDARDRDGATALHHATTFAGLAMVDALLERGADPDAAELSGYTPLHNAILRGDPALVERLLAAGARLTSILPDGRAVLEVVRTKRLRRLLARHLGGS